MSSVHPKVQLRDAGLKPKHQFGQNFLSDASLCARIAALAAPEGTEATIEIGAGLGALTAALLERTRRVIAIERDRDLVPQLRSTFADALLEDRLNVVEDDAKAYDYVSAFQALGGRCTLAGNLPYQITGPLLKRSIEVAPYVARCTFLVQLEVADRLTASPGGEAYGALSIFLQARYAVRRELIVRRGAFYPQPNVDSAVVVLDPLATPISVETPLFRGLVKSAFLQRRKKLRNAWSGVAGVSSAALAQAAKAASIDLDLRGEVLSVEQFASMAQAVEDSSAASKGTE